MKRLWFRILVGTVMFVSACSGGMFLWVAVDTADSASEAESFLALWLDGEIHNAYASTASEFRAGQDEATFAMAVELMGMRNYALEAWRDRRLERRQEVEYRGVLQQRAWYDDPLELPFSLGLVKEGTEWKVRSFTGPERFFSPEGDIGTMIASISPGGRGNTVGPGAWFSQTPSEDELLRMARETLLDFDQAVKDGDFQQFYEGMSRSFKVVIPLKTLQSAYQRFIDKGVDISGVADVKPEWDGLPKMERSSRIGNLLIVSGYFPIEPAPVPFLLQYHYEHPDWLLHKFLVDLPDLSQLTREHCLKWLISQAEQDISQCFDPEDNEKTRTLKNR